jgi:flagellar hook-associated protein 2
MDRIPALSAVSPYQENMNWLASNSGQQLDRPKAMSDFMARYQFIRYAQETYARTSAKGIASILSAAKDVQQAASSLLDKSDSAFGKREAESDSPAVTAEAASGAERRSYRVQVDSVAEAQVNSGASFVPSSTTSIRSGWNELDIRTDTRTTRVSFWVNAGDTHGQALTRMRQAINGSDGGVFARTVTDAKGLISLEITGDHAGAAQGFTVTDVKGNAVSATASHLVEHAAMDAVYRIDGGPSRTSESNRVLLDEGRVAITLRGTTANDRPATVAVKPDRDAVFGQVKELISRYNELQQQFAEAAGYVAPSVGHRIRNALVGASLDDLGIERRADGKLELDERRLGERIDTDYEAVVADIGGSGGFAARLEKMGARLQAAPAESLLDRRNSQFMRYANYLANTELYSQLPSNGRLVNRIF